MSAEIGLIGLAVMGQVSLLCRAEVAQLTLDSIVNERLPVQNLALNVASKGFTISVFNRTYEKTEKAVARAQKEGERTPAPHHSYGQPELMPGMRTKPWLLAAAKP